MPQLLFSVPRSSFGPSRAQEFSLAAGLALLALACPPSALASSALACPGAASAEQAETPPPHAIRSGAVEAMLRDAATIDRIQDDGARELAPVVVLAPPNRPSLPPSSFQTQVIYAGRAYLAEARFVRNDGTDGPIAEGPHVARNTPRYGLRIDSVSPSGQRVGAITLSFARARATALGRTVRFEARAAVDGEPGTVVILLNQRVGGRTRGREAIWVTEGASVRFILDGVNGGTSS